MLIQEIIEAHDLINRSVEFLSAEIDKVCLELDKAERIGDDIEVNKIEDQLAALIQKCKAENKQLDIWEAKLKKLKAIP